MPRGWLARYANWLHTRWPAGAVEKLPEISPDGRTAVPGVRIVGDLTGVPLLKFAADSGARAVQDIVAEPDFSSGRSEDPGVLDLAIVGGGVSGIAAAIEARKEKLRFEVFESAEAFSTVANFPTGKPIFTFPPGMTPAGGLRFRADVHPKEDLLESLETQRREAGIEVTRSRIERIERIERRGGLWLARRADGRVAARARRVIVAIGRSGSYRRLNVPGESSGKVFNRLHDPKDFAGKRVLVVGGGDSAFEAALALSAAGAIVTLSYRGEDLSRPKAGNVEGIRRLDEASRRRTPGDSRGAVHLALGTEVVRIEPDRVILRDRAGGQSEIPNDAVFPMLGREAPLEFFRMSGIPIRGEWTARRALALGAFLVFCVALYGWKSAHREIPLQRLAQAHGAFPFDVPALLERAGGRLAEWSGRETNLLFTLKRGLGNPAFYYTLAYCTAVIVFGIRRIRRRRTPYVARQTLVLIAVQVLPLFLLPEIILPWMGRNGLFSRGGPLQWIADHLFERYDLLGHERAYWRAYGFILAFPLNVYNVFTDRPLGLWLAIAFVQTFVLLPLLIRRYGKGVYCGWICSCGALAETLGDEHRQKMPHGPAWNRWNLVGQAVLAFAFLLLGLRIAGWAMGAGSRPARAFRALFERIPFLNYSWSVDILLAGIVGLGAYFWFSGRVWCRFACPLAALMHVYARFSRFRIFAEKSRCISCNVCTANCHQGIDVMNFANRGLPMEDPECVRCSACVQMCPTGVLAFGRLGKAGLPVLDRLPASPVKMSEEPSSPAAWPLGGNGNTYSRS